MNFIDMSSLKHFNEVKSVRYVIDEPNRCNSNNKITLSLFTSLYCFQRSTDFVNLNLEYWRVCVVVTI